MTIFHNLTISLSRYRARRYRPMAITAFFLIALSSLVLADGGIIHVARISLIEGEVSYQRANDTKKDWFDADPNLPLGEGDQIYNGPNGRAEIQMSGRNTVRINHNTNLRFTQFNTGVIQLALPVGTATFRIDSLDRRQFRVVDARDANLNDPVYFEVDTPIVAITLLKEGDYRVNVNDNGTTEVIVRRGQAEVYNQELGTITVKQGRRFVIDGNDADNFQIAKLEDKDNWDRWNDRRDDELFSRVDSYRSTRHIPAAVPGVYDLDRYGEWFETPEYGWVWGPRDVASDWAPYRHGCWRWYPAYGWTWASHEPWGWVPYHYGRWAYWGSRWCWVPSVIHGIGAGFGWNWSPHHVVFFGWGGGGYNRGYRDGYRDGRYSWLGWCPLGPGETNVANNQPRSIESLRNHRAPGGLSRMEGRRFEQSRVIVTNDTLIAPPRGVVRGDPATPVLVKADEIKPTQTAPTRTALIERPEVARRLEAPVIIRRAATGSRNSSLPTQSGDADSSRRSKVVRDGVVVPSETDRGTTRRTGDSDSSTTRINDGQIRSSDRPTRSTDYRQVERANPPAWGSKKEETRTIERSDSSNERPMPSRSVDRPSRSESEHRHADPPSQPQVERRPTPRYERESAPPREYRRPDPPPAREQAPSRNVERPSTPPPPPKESAPSRNVERPSTLAPARESAPSRNPERSLPSRRPE
ncbi:MAG: FecR domain-containing protein [Acidobacteria bacterium]|nr:FecR domain-containing protein [Acidobacteriota bacterium]